MKKESWSYHGMSVKVNLELTATDAAETATRRDIIIVIDVLRCSSSILNAFANGAKVVIPAKTIREARNLHNSHPGSLLAGERKGLKPRGFDFGNSPLEFTSEKVHGRTLIFTTTSGTVALAGAKRAEWVLIGAFLNVSSVAKRAMEIAKGEGIDTTLLLSGRKGHFSLEDFVCAGAVTRRLREGNIHLSDAASAALLAFNGTKNNLCKSIMNGEHTKYLSELGFERDIELCCQLDAFPIAPVYKDGIITVS